MKDEGGRMKVRFHRRRAECGRECRDESLFILHPSSLILSLVLIVSVIPFTSSASAQRRSGAHSARKPDAFTSADRAIVERAIGATCSQRLRDPQASAPIDEMQSRPSLPVSDPDATS